MRRHIKAVLAPVVIVAAIAGAAGYRAQDSGSPRRLDELSKERPAAASHFPVDGALAAAKKRAAAPTGRGGGGGGSVGGSCGGATNGADRFIGAESGGNPNARNPSGAWGCYQIMPGTWRGSCSDLGQHGSASTDAQAQCASRLPSSSWAASGG
jgi:hypothetical protein